MDRALEELFNNSAFLTEVEQFRKTNKIPKLGFTDIQKYRKYKEDSVQKKKVSAQAAKMARARKLPHPYIQWIDVFIGLGFECTEYIIPFSKGQAIPGHSYEMESETDHVVFRAYKGSSLNGFIKFVRSRWGITDYWFKEMKSEEEAPAVRKKSILKKARNRQILDLHLGGYLRADGSWKDKERDQPDFIKELSQEQKRRIIQAEKKLMKISIRHKR